MYSNACTSSSTLPAIVPAAPDTPADPGPSRPPPGWIFSYPVGGNIPGGSGAHPAPGTMLHLHMAADLKHDPESLPPALAVISTTTTGRMLLCELSRWLDGQPLSIARAVDPHQAGMFATPQGGLLMALYPDTLLSHGTRMQAHSGCPRAFSSRQQYACGLFEFLLSAVNYFEMGTFAAGQRINIHPRTAAFRQALLDAARQPQAAGLAAAAEENVEPRAGLRVGLDPNMIPYRDGFHRVLTTLRGIAPGMHMLTSYAHAIATGSMTVYHVDNPGDAGILLGVDGVIYWHYNVGAMAAHAALLQTTRDDLTHEQRDACAAFDLLIKSRESIGRGRFGPGDRLDLDFTRRHFRDELIAQFHWDAAASSADTMGGIRV